MAAPDTRRLANTAAVDATVYELALQLRDCNNSIAMWQQHQRHLREQLLKIMGPYERAEYCGQHVLTITRSRPRRFNSKAFAADHPGLDEAYRIEGDEVVTLKLAPELGGGDE